MNKNKWFVAFRLLPILLFLVIACGSEATATPPPPATATPLPTATATPPPTATATPPPWAAEWGR